MKKIELMALPYAVDALEPVISKQTLEFHHGKHLAGYVNNLNGLLEGSPLAGLPLEKDRIYREAAKTGAKMVLAVINDKNSKVPTPQDDTKATFCGKLDKAMGLLTPEIDTAEQILRKIIAFQGFPKPKYAFFGLKCIVLEAHMLKSGETAPLVIPCLDKRSVAVDLLQPEGRKPMDAISFINGYKK